MCSLYLADDSNTLTAMNPESVHPLTAPETDVYDNANSLQVLLWSFCLLNYNYI